MAMGLLFVLALLQNLISSKVQLLSARVLGYRTYLYSLAIVGVPIHELGHLVFALLFGHKITEVKLFQTQGDTLGYIRHSYNPKNLYHLIGNVFIGAGPILFGSLLLYLAAHFIFDWTFSSYVYSVEPMQQLSSVSAMFSSLGNAVFSCGSLWRIVLFSYLVLAIGSNITLSKADLQGVAKGVLPLFLLIFLFNLSTLWIDGFTQNVFLTIGRLAMHFTLMLALSILLNALLWVLLFLFKLLLRR